MPKDFAAATGFSRPSMPLGPVPGLEAIARSFAGRRMPVPRPNLHCPGGVGVF
ncbi:MAG: hypothetical protein SFU83_02335 [Meiothermus sp.]|nr:hypothetical protein [Meiothermus sp.]